ncbi:MAG: HAMP domain-containing histidine kinase [Balneolaceae bacterium]|nr:HAMP domain-containing histidine kinase [Balneolaceae bacterium]
MQNRWFTYSFLVVIVGALVTLAVLQYSWLGSVSDAERQRLNEGIEASTENFISDFNEAFSEVYRAFRLQVTNSDNSDQELETRFLENVAQWYTTEQQNSIVDNVYLIKDREDLVSIYQADIELMEVSEIEADTALIAWLDEHSITDSRTNSMPLSNFPDLGSPSFLKIPVQVLDFITLNRNEGVENLEVRLSIDQLDDYVLIRLNDDAIKEQLIPEIASRYLGDSYQDQYQLAIVNEDDNQHYFSDGGEQETPEFSKNLERLNFSSLMFLETDSAPRKMEEDSVVFSVFSSHSERIITRERGANRGVLSEEERSDIDIDLTNKSPHFEAFDSTIRDTSITTAFVGNVSKTGWKLWLSFKAGSLDEFVSKTRNRNLTISFGILLVLGISGVMIIIYAQRSRELAEQQMLFVAGVSHELRTPITVIRSAAENLSEGVIQNEERKQEYAQLMLAESKRLSEMVDQIMEFSGIQSGKKIYNFSDVAIDTLMQQILEELTPIADQKNIEFQFSNISKVPVVQADKDALFLAITNLLRNAIKFSEDGGKVIFRVDETSFRSGLGLRIQIQDFGIGIPDDEQKKIFQPFYRAEYAVSQQIKGNGIGLSLVERVAKEHEGDITVKSTPGKGSTFTLLIPLHK